MDKNIKAFTLIELIIAVLITTILLGGIFYFMSGTILSISRASAHSKFLKDFYSFTTIFNTWELEIISNSDKLQGFDVAMLTSLDRLSWVLVGVVDYDTLRLSGTESFDTYHQAVLWYRSLSWNEISAIDSNEDIIYDYDFVKGNLFSNFYLRDFQLEMFNSGTTMSMDLSIFPDYKINLEWEPWDRIPQDEVFYYSLTF